MFIVQFENGGKPYYLASWSGGDPSRTLIKSLARRFKTHKDAEKARDKAINENPHRYEGKVVNTRIFRA